MHSKKTPRPQWSLKINTLVYFLDQSQWLASWPCRNWRGENPWITECTLSALEFDISVTLERGVSDVMWSESCSRSFPSKSCCWLLRQGWTSAWRLPEFAPRYREFCGKHSGKRELCKRCLLHVNEFSKVLQWPFGDVDARGTDNIFWNSHLRALRGRTCFKAACSPLAMVHFAAL